MNIFHPAYPGVEDFVFESTVEFFRVGFCKKRIMEKECQNKGLVVVAVVRCAYFIAALPLHAP